MGFPLWCHTQPDSSRSAFRPLISNSFQRHYFQIYGPLPLSSYKDRSVENLLLPNPCSLGSSQVSFKCHSIPTEINMHFNTPLFRDTSFQGALKLCLLAMTPSLCITFKCQCTFWFLLLRDQLDSSFCKEFQCWRDSQLCLHGSQGLIWS